MRDVTDFESLWTEAVHYRHVSRSLRGLVESVYSDLLHRSPAFLASPYGRTDANCCAVDRFFAGIQPMWRDLPPPLREIFSDMSGTLHDAIYAPGIAASFSSLPELLERICSSS